MDSVCDGESSVETPAMNVSSASTRSEQRRLRIALHLPGVALKRENRSSQSIPFLEYLLSARYGEAALLDRKQQDGSDDASEFFGHVLHFAQNGERHDSANVLNGFGSAGILGVVENDADGTSRAVYTVEFREAGFVVHSFQKKSKTGIATPKKDMDIIRARLKVVEALAEEKRDEKSKS